MLLKHFLSSCDQYFIDLKAQELQLVIIGTIFSVLGLFLNRLALKEFKNRINDSKALLRIIP